MKDKYHNSHTVTRNMIHMKYLLHLTCTSLHTLYSSYIDNSEKLDTGNRVYLQKRQITSVTQAICRMQMEDKQLSYRRETARCRSYFDLQNCEVEFLSHPFGGLGETQMLHVLHVYVVGRSVVDFLQVIIEHFSQHSQLRNCVVEFLSHPLGDLGERQVFYLYPMELVSQLEFNIPFQHKYGYIRDDIPVAKRVSTSHKR